MNQTIKYEAWIALTKTGAMRMTKGQPKIAGNERRLKLKLEVPAHIFQEPELSASVVFNGEPPTVDTFELEANVADALQKAGMNVVVQVVEHESDEELLSVVGG